MLLAGALSACALAQSTGTPDSLRKQFANPPATAKLWCYWWWLNGNTTEATITRDLTEMGSKGFGGVLLVDGNGSNQNGNDDVPPGPRFGSQPWVRLYVHALKTANRLHLNVNLNVVSGWNLGGPDVTPAQASKLLTWSRTIVEDGKSFDGVLPMPPVKNGFYRQIAVLAYPIAALEDGVARNRYLDAEVGTSAGRRARNSRRTGHGATRCHRPERAGG